MPPDSDVEITSILRQHRFDATTLFHGLAKGKPVFDRPCAGNPRSAGRQAAVMFFVYGFMIYTNILVLKGVNFRDFSVMTFKHRVALRLVVP